MGRNVLSRRDFLKASGFSAGALALGSLSHVPLSFAAKDVYPSEKITFILPHSAGGGFVLIARGISPYITKYLREAAPGTRGGDVLVRNEPAVAERLTRATLLLLPTGSATTWESSAPPKPTSA